MRPLNFALLALLFSSTLFVLAVSAPNWKQRKIAQATDNIEMLIKHLDAEFNLLKASLVDVNVSEAKLNSNLVVGSKNRLLALLRSANHQINYLVDVALSGSEKGEKDEAANWMRPTAKAISQQ